MCRCSECNEKSPLPWVMAYLVRNSTVWVNDHYETEELASDAAARLIEKFGEKISRTLIYEG